MRTFEKFCLFALSVILCSLCWAAEMASEREFLVGGDISMLTKIEEHGGVFRDEGRPLDFLRILKKYGCNCQRLRIPVSGLRIWNGGSIALFDTQGNALPALKAFASPIVSDGAGLILKNKTICGLEQK
jgi:arabinogalactan endo-1,4-beta-galactosidase